MRTSGFVNGFVLGSLIGAAVAFLYTPDSGENVRGQARGFVKNFGSEVKEAAITRRAQLEAELANLRTPHKPGEESA